MIWILWLYLINILFMLIIAVREVRRPAKALNWLVISLVLPVIGFVLYLSTANPMLNRQKLLLSPQNESDSLPNTFSQSTALIAQALRKFTVNGLRTGQVQWLTNGTETYDKLIESLGKAQKSIEMEYYIFRNDNIGKIIRDLLIERSEAGIQVRFIRDGWGSRKFPKQQIAKMMEAGIECRTFFPMRFPWFTSNWNYRDHCKIVVIDDNEVFTGGINVGYEYTGHKKNTGFWRDTHIQIKGEAVNDLKSVFEEHWKIASPERGKVKKSQNQENNTRIQSMNPSEANLKWSAEFSTEINALDEKEADPNSAIKPIQQAYIQTLQDSPGIPTQTIRESFFICLTQASKTIDITTPYFIPDADIIMALKTAVARGVRVRLLVPFKVDEKIVGHASRTYYGELVEAGVQIYLYKKGIFHVKSMIIDGEISEIGAANYDMRSFRLNYETCEMIYSIEAAKQLTEQFEKDLTDSIELRIEELEKRTFSERVVEQSARIFSPLL